MCDFLVSPIASPDEKGDELMDSKSKLESFKYYHKSPK